MKIGIIGAGQLARMLVVAGTPLGFSFSCIGKADSCATDITSVVDIDLKDTQALLQWAQDLDVITFENENIDCTLFHALRDRKTLHPSLKAIECTQDRLKEKRMLNSIHIKTAPFSPIDTFEDLQVAAQKHGTPAIVKTRRFGYDGKGQFFIKEKADVEKAWEALGRGSCGLIWEKFIPFDFEVSQICTVSNSGDIAFYPLVKNVHRKGILFKSSAPFTNTTLEETGRTIAEKIAKHLEYVGTLSIEFFAFNHELIVNEIAPRVHNSGHWTIEGSHTSQFENHLRAICGLSLGETKSVPTVMINCIGRMPNVQDTCAIRWIKRHDYNKKPMPGRKVGHITVLVGTEEGKQALDILSKRVEQLSKQ